MLSNHDVTRPVTRYGRADTSFSFESKRAGTPTDLARGTRRARAAALLAMALPGSMYVYQGEELGLPEVEDIPADRRQDPMWHRSGGVDPGRDGCRDPAPVVGRRARRTASARTAADRPGSTSPTTGRALTVAAQTEDPASMLALYRARAAAPPRRRRGATATDSLARLRPTTSLAFARGDRFVCLVNFGPEPVALPPGADVLIASDELEGGALPQDTTVWLRQARPATRSTGQGKEGTMKSIRMVAAAVAVAGLLAVCAARPPPSASTAKTVTISVASLIPGSTPAAIQQFNDAGRAVREGEPDDQGQAGRVPVDRADFAAKLAAGTLPTVFEVPFTDARTLGDNGQLADLTAEVKALPYFSEVQPGGPRGGHDSKGKIVALPKGAYAQALHYNRKLFQQAGLDPNKPPTTWAQIAGVREADRREDRQGRLRGDGRRPTTPRGWILTTLVYSLGGRMEIGHRHEREGDPRQQADGHGAEHAQEDALDRQLDGLELRLRLERHQPGVRRRQRRHVHQRLGRLHEPRAGRATSTRASTASRRSRSRRTRPPACSAAARSSAVRPDANAAAQAAAVKWIDFFYEQPLVTKTQAIRNAQDARGEQAAGRRAGAAALQQGAVRPGEHVDQAVHQRPARRR